MLSSSELENRFLQLENTVNRALASQGRIVSVTEPEVPTLGLSWFDLMTNTEKTWNWKSWISGGINVKVWAITISGTGPLSITGIGFTPKAIMVMASNGSATPRIVQSTGYTDGNNTTIQHIWEDTAPPNYNSELVNNTSGVLLIYLQRNGTDLVRWDFTSFDVDGFTLNILSNGIAGSKFSYMAFG